MASPGREGRQENVADTSPTGTGLTRTERPALAGPPIQDSGLSGNYGRLLRWGDVYLRNWPFSKSTSTLRNGTSS